jgi:hypothetical protein
MPFRRCYSGGYDWRTDHWRWRGWWSSGRTRYKGRRDDGEHRAADRERQKKFKSVPYPCLRRCVGGSLCVLGNWLGYARVLPIVEASTGNGCGCVRPPLRILANAEAPYACRIPNTGFREIQPEWSEFETATESPSHSLPSLPRLGGNFATF